MNSKQVFYFIFFLPCNVTASGHCGITPSASHKIHNNKDNPNHITPNP